MKLKDRRMWPRRIRAQVLRMHPGGAHTREVEIEAFGTTGPQRRVGAQFDLRIHGDHLLQCPVPVRVEIGGAWIDARILSEFGQGFVEGQRHDRRQTKKCAGRNPKCGCVAVRAGA